MPRPILVKIPAGVEPEEWAVIELQGELESRHHDNLMDLFIGDLHYTNEGVPILIIGHHILYGKETTLTKPFGILERKRTNDLDESVISQSPGSEQALLRGGGPVEFKTEYLVRAIVKKKLLFKTRPKPIIANFAKSV